MIPRYVRLDGVLTTVSQIAFGTLSCPIPVTSDERYTDAPLADRTRRCSHRTDILIGSAPTCECHLREVARLGKTTFEALAAGFTLIPCKPRFDGATYVPVRANDPTSDRDRLAKQLTAVRQRMSDGEWHTLVELAEAAGCETQSASARLRDLRKARFGGHRVERRYVSRGLFEYRLEVG